MDTLIEFVPTQRRPTGFTPVLAIKETSVKPNDRVQLYGRGFPASVRFTRVLVGGTSVPIEVTSDQDGVVSTFFVIPPTIKPGPNTLSLETFNFPSKVASQYPTGSVNGRKEMQVRLERKVADPGLFCFSQERYYLGAVAKIEYEDCPTGSNFPFKIYKVSPVNQVEIRSADSMTQQDLRVGQECSSERLESNVPEYNETTFGSCEAEPSFYTIDNIQFLKQTIKKTEINVSPWATSSASQVGSTSSARLTFGGLRVHKTAKGQR